MFRSQNTKNVIDAPTAGVFDQRVLAEVQAAQEPYRQMLATHWKGASVESLRYDPERGSLSVRAGGLFCVLSVAAQHTAAQITAMVELEKVRVFVTQRNSTGIGVFFTSPSWCYSIPLLTVSEPLTS